MKRVLLMSIAVLAMASTAHAEFDYTFIQGNIGSVEFDDFNADGTIFGVDASMAINDDFHVFGGGDFANLSQGVDAVSWAAGLGYNTPLNEVVDIVAQLSFRYIDFDSRNGSSDDTGIGLSVFARWAATDRVEINGGLDHDESTDNTSLIGAALYNIDERYTVGLSGSFDDDATVLNLVGRMYFY